MKNKKIKFLYCLFIFQICFILSYLFLVKMKEFSGMVYKPNVTVWSQTNLGADFVNDYVAARILRLGLNPYKNYFEYRNKFFDPYAGGEWSRFTFGPLAAYLFIPLSFLSYVTAYHIWIYLLVLFMILGLWFISKPFKNRLPILSTFMLVSILSYPLYFAIERGNFDIFIFFLLSMGFCLVKEEKNPWLASIFFAVSILTKIYPGLLLIYFLFKRQWSLLFKVLVMIAILTIITFNLAVYKSAFWLIRWVAITPGSWVGNHSLSSFLGILGFPLHLIPIISGVISFILVTITMVLSLLNRTKDDVLMHFEWGMLSLLMLIIPNRSEDYTLILLFFSLVAIFIFLEQYISKYILIVVILLTTLIMLLTYQVLPIVILTNKFPLLILYWILIAILDIFYRKHITSRNKI